MSRTNFIGLIGSGRWGSSSGKPKVTYAARILLLTNRWISERMAAPPVSSTNGAYTGRGKEDGWDANKWEVP